MQEPALHDAEHYTRHHRRSPATHCALHCSRVPTGNLVTLYGFARGHERAPNHAANDCFLSPLRVAMLAVAQIRRLGPFCPMRWADFPPTIPGLKGTWILGSEKEMGTYVQRVILSKGARIPTHTHPDSRYSTILSGTLYVAFGAKPAEADFVAVPVGGVYVAPAGQVHTLWARDGEVVYQEAGNGPTGTSMVD